MLNNGQPRRMSAPSKSILQDPQLRLALGGVLLNANQDQQALSVFQQAVNVKPDLANAHYNVAQAYLKLQQYDAAKQEYDAVLQLLDPTSEDYTKATSELEQIQNWSTNNQLQMQPQAIRLEMPWKRPQPAHLRCSTNSSTHQLNKRYSKLEKHNPFPQQVRQNQLVRLWSHQSQLRQLNKNRVKT